MPVPLWEVKEGMIVQILLFPLLIFQSIPLTISKNRYL
jgi:hypothetical protein